MATLIQLMQNELGQKDALLPNETKRIILKEFLQAYTLDFLYNHPLYRKLNFYGGTCLHVCYGLNRLSEDLDLDNSSSINLDNLEKDLLVFFRNIYEFAEISGKTQIGERGIHRTILKFPVLYPLGLASNPNELLHLKVEISQHRQISILHKTPILLYGRSFVASHFSLETMMAGKMIACLERDFKKGKATVKGRDFYDLLWFMQQKIQPMEEKLAQDGKQPYTVKSSMEMLSKQISLMNAATLADDLLPLFEQRPFIEAWLQSFKENFEQYLKYYL
jgi:predicted nucleotidyltransferase component of viral defense system